MRLTLISISSSRVAVVGHCNQGLTEERTAQEQLHSENSAKRGNDDEKFLRENARRTDQHHGLTERGGKLDLLGTPKLHRRVLENDADCDRAEHPREGERMAYHGADGDLFKPDTHCSCQQHHCKHGDCIWKTEAEVTGEPE